ncbi:alpha/beta hydrolase [Pediococcus argentinicus]|uniref:alpha/beta fold hydrolase n=1 Tax=Pediococcus argentinicus TaxID=480391 RepID=UPI00338E9FD0
MFFKTKDQVSLYYDDVGEGQPLVFLTGFSGNTEIWFRQREYFKKNFRVITLDYRNHGRSDRVDYGIRINKLATDVVELLEFLKVKQPIIVGNSMGGSIALNIAKNEGWNFFKKMVIVDQSPKMIHENGWNYGFKDLRRDNFFNVISVPLKHANFSRLDDDVYKRSKAVDIEHPFSNGANGDLMTDHSLKDWRQVLKDSDKPVLFILGEQSPFYDIRDSNQLEQFGNNVEIKHIDQAGHLPMAEQPDQFNEILLQFIKE